MCKSVFYGPEWLYLGECSMWAWEECVSCCLDEVDVTTSRWWVVLSSPMSLVTFWLLDLPLSEGEVLKWIHPFLLEFYQFLHHVVWCCLIRRRHVRGCYVFLENWPLVLTSCPSLSQITLPALKSALSESNVATSACFWLVSAWSVFLYPFTFNLCVFIFKVGFFR